MAGPKLPTFSRAEVESHKSAKSCFVTIGNKVYDVTDFLDSHPGGAGFILDYAGKDIDEILKDESSHAHSETAYEVLDESLVGYLSAPNGAAMNGNGKANGKANGNGKVAEASGVDSDAPYVHPRTGMATAEDMEKDTDYDLDYKKHKFLDLNKPLFPQVFFGGFSKEFYLDQVHRPRHYKGGESAPFFGNFLEPLSKTPWWVIPTIWLPCVAYGTYLASPGFDNPIQQAGWWLLGIFIWSLVEYVLHRFLFHLDGYLPDNRFGITLHFLLHGVHHYLPMDKYRLVMPPALLMVLAGPFWRLAHTIFYWNWYLGTNVFCGGFFGYVCYDCTHYFLHHQNLPLWYPMLKKYHLEHHFLDYEAGFGVSSMFWDYVFGTEFKRPALEKAN